MVEKRIRYYIQKEYEIVDYFKNKYTVSYLCQFMSVSRSGYYKWKFRKENPTLKTINRESDINFIKSIYKQHKSRGYRWLNRYIRNIYEVFYTDNYVHRICKYENIRYQGKHYKWKKPGETKI